ncbi:MAG: hypothetical protein QUU85_08685 [Candidatus Eisenbacteria bacterium]|nr:hypothetical protein [Candidatus Eisenbacteria bacterium]
MDDYLYDIGLFTSAGAKPSWSVARWSDSPAAAPEPILGAARGGIQLLSLIHI